MYTGGRYVTYTYNSAGQIAELAWGDGSGFTATCWFECDTSGRLIRSRELNGTTTTQRTEHLYDEYDRLYIQRWDIDGKTRSEKYTYDDGTDGDGALTQFKSGSGHKINYTYDALRRLTTASVTNSSDVELFKTAYAYLTLTGSQTSTLVQYRSVRAPDGTLLTGHRYYYDAIGNITKIVNTGTGYTVAEYAYDNQNQLTQVIYYTSAGAVGDTCTYTYDTAGNIRTEAKNGTTTKTYAYDNADWVDLLTSVNGNTITYDANGNPLTYHNGTTSYTGLTWEHGRQLTSITTGGKTYTYAYDADGIRTQKVVDGVTHTYITQNGKLVRESFPYGDTTIIMDFIYDESGKPFAVCYSKNGGTSYTTYFYGINAQGDVEKLFRMTKNADTGEYEETVYGRYVYDAWGNVTATTAAGAAAGTTTLVYRNPIRYRGYCYDNETGFYYLQSRYYDPANHRFINADGYASTGQGFTGTNMFAYCLNNPINYEDHSGNLPQINSSFYTMRTVEDTAPGGFWFTPVFYKTMDEAAMAAGREANLLTQETDMEYACAIYQVGGTYYYGSIYMGAHTHGVSDEIQAECKALGATIAAFVHTHPNCTCTVKTVELFSDRDKATVKSSKVPLYLAAPTGRLIKLEFVNDEYWRTTYFNKLLPVDNTVCECPYL